MVLSWRHCAYCTEIARLVRGGNGIPSVPSKGMLKLRDSYGRLATWDTKSELDAARQSSTNSYSLEPCPYL